MGEIGVWLERSVRRFCVYLSERLANMKRIMFEIEERAANASWDDMFGSMPRHLTC